MTAAAAVPARDHAAWLRDHYDLKFWNEDDLVTLARLDRELDRGGAATRACPVVETCAAHCGSCPAWEWTP